MRIRNLIGMMVLGFILASCGGGSDGPKPTATPNGDVVSLQVAASAQAIRLSDGETAVADANARSNREATAQALFAHYTIATGEAQEAVLASQATTIAAMDEALSSQSTVIAQKGAELGAQSTLIADQAETGETQSTAAAEQAGSLTTLQDDSATQAAVIGEQAAAIDAQGTTVAMGAEAGAAQSTVVADQANTINAQSTRAAAQSTRVAVQETTISRQSTTIAQTGDEVEALSGTVEAGMISLMLTMESQSTAVAAGGGNQPGASPTRYVRQTSTPQTGGTSGGTTTGRRRELSGRYGTTREEFEQVWGLPTSEEPTDENRTFAIYAGGPGAGIGVTYVTTDPNSRLWLIVIPLDNGTDAENLKNAKVVVVAFAPTDADCTWTSAEDLGGTDSRYQCFSNALDQEINMGVFHAYVGISEDGSQLYVGIG